MAPPLWDSHCGSSRPRSRWAEPPSPRGRRPPTSAAAPEFPLNNNRTSRGGGPNNGVARHSPRGANESLPRRASRAAPVGGGEGDALRDAEVPDERLERAQPRQAPARAVRGGAAECVFCQSRDDVPASGCFLPGPRQGPSCVRLGVGEHVENVHQGRGRRTDSGPSTGPGRGSGERVAGAPGPAHQRGAQSGAARLAVALAVEQHVGALNVAMRQAGGIERGQALAHLEVEGGKS